MKYFTIYLLFCFSETAFTQTKHLIFVQKKAVQLAPPILTFDQTFFIENTTVQINLGLGDVRIHYTLDSSEPTEESPLYQQSILIDKTVILNAKVFHECCKMSETVTTHFFKTGQEIPVKTAILTNTPHENYTANDAATLIDFQKGSTDFKDKKWLGFDGKDVEFVVEFSKKKKLKRAIISTLGNADAWIFLPTSVEIYQSKDGQKFKQIAVKDGFKNEENGRTGFQFLNLNFKSKKRRFYKIIVKNQGKIPEWHIGKGTAAWLFVDEILLF